MSTDDPNELTPVENRDGMLYKREDLYRLPNGVNGSKLRACGYLMDRAVEQGAEVVISAASVHSPQSAMAATCAANRGLTSVTVVGGTTPEKAVKHTAIHIAQEQGSLVTAIKVGYNPALQAEGRRLADATPGGWQVPYGITTPPESSREDVLRFTELGARQVANLPDDLETLVIPFGSGNTAAGILWGLLTLNRPRNLRRVALMTVGPDKMIWLRDRIRWLGGDLEKLPLEQYMLHPGFATYGDKMRESMDGIDFHPTYEGKVVRYLNTIGYPWWEARDGKTLLWVVGGPLR